MFEPSEVRAGGDRALWAVGRKYCPRYLIPLHPGVTPREGQERLIASPLTEVFWVGIIYSNSVTACYT